MKTVYGECRSWDKAFWAYSVKDSKAVLVRCPDRQTAVEEKDRMKCSDARTVGFTGKAVEEMEMRSACKSRGWKVICIR